MKHKKQEPENLFFRNMSLPPLLFVSCEGELLDKGMGCCCDALHTLEMKIFLFLTFFIECFYACFTPSFYGIFPFNSAFLLSGASLFCLVWTFFSFFLMKSGYGVRSTRTFILMMYCVTINIMNATFVLRIILLVCLFSHLSKILSFWPPCGYSFLLKMKILIRTIFHSGKCFWQFIYKYIVQTNACVCNHYHWSYCLEIKG